jgi:hypothetical protein
MGLRLPPGAASLPLRVRIGIHTGMVVVGVIGTGPRQELMALGTTPNVASRLQVLADAGSVVVSEATFRLIERSFKCHDLGVRSLKGLSAPFRLYAVLAEAGAGNRVDAVAPSELTPLVGRDHELALLRARWTQTVNGAGQAIWMTGEPGIGKSRLVRAFADDIGPGSHIRWSLRCSPYHQDSPFHPIADLFHGVFFLDPLDSAPTKLDKIERGLEQRGLAAQNIAPLWAALLSIPLPEPTAPQLSPSRQRQKTFDAVLGLLQVTATRQPLLLVVEDGQWADPSTREFLDFLLRQGPPSSVLVLLVGRPEFRPSRDLESRVVQLTLNRLTRAQTQLLAELVAKRKVLPGSVLQQIVDKTDGVPLFVEELTRAVLESSLLTDGRDLGMVAQPLGRLGIPSTLQDSLMGRLDRLGSTKEVAQLGAALGRDFSYRVLAAVSRLDDDTLRRHLARLVEADLLRQEGESPNATYVFKHALIQEVAYHSLLKSRRQKYHHHIARVLAEQFPETLATHPELVAHHYAQAGEEYEAIAYYRTAGELALARSATSEAIGHLQKGLELVNTPSATGERAEQELALQTALGVALTAATGYAAPEVGQAYARARELCRDTGDVSQVFPVLRGLAAFHYVRAELQAARSVVEEFVSLAERQPDLALLMGARLELGSILFNLGEFHTALETSSIVPWRCTIARATGRRRCGTARILACPASSVAPPPWRCLDIQHRPGSARRRQWCWLAISPIPIRWSTPSSSPPRSASSLAIRAPLETWPAKRSAWLAIWDSLCGSLWRDSSTAGHSPGEVVSAKGHRAWSPNSRRRWRWDPRSLAPTFSRCSPSFICVRGKRSGVFPSSGTRWPSPIGPGTAGTKRRCTASKGNSCSGRARMLARAPCTPRPRSV